ncbi:MAG: AAA family ATPase [Bacteroides sp. CAG:1060_57_27]|nr:MAG: AAA family ATPase [Bacteroides sp. CAG:1060_57_27]
MEYIRRQYTTLKERIEEPRKFIQVIAGPRQVGKTTLVNQVLRQIELAYAVEVADGVDAKDTDWIRRVWDSARTAMLFRKEKEYLLVIDEIQKIANWSEAVKKEWDEDTRKGVNLKVVLLGSSRLLLKKGLTESLAGRYELIRLGHWRYQEMRDAFGFTLDEYVYFGGYPGPAHLIRNERRWKKYVKDSLVAPAIDKDVIMTSNIYKPALMKRLFELGCGYSAEILSLTKLIGQLQDAGNVTTLAGYLEILNQCSLLAALQKYARDDARKYNSIPKYQVYNNALMTVYRGQTFEKDRTDPKVWGRWVESAVGAYLLSMAEELDYQLYYWREGDDEVDFIIANGGESVAIEVKSGRRGMNSGLPKFVKAFQPKLSFVVGTSGVSLEDFLSSDLDALIH